MATAGDAPNFTARSPSTMAGSQTETTMEPPSLAARVSSVRRSTGERTAVARQITWNVRCWFILFGPKLRLWVIDSG